MYSEEDLEKQKQEKKAEEKRQRVNKFLGTNNSDPKQQEQEEEFYDDFFRYEKGLPEGEIEEEPELETESKKESRGSFVVIIILLLVFSVLGILFTKSFSKANNKVDEKEPIVTVIEANVEVDEKGEYKLQYSFDNFTDDPKTTFVSSDESIVTVTNEGVVTGVKAGTARIIMSYFIKEISYQKEFSVIVRATTDPEPEKPTDPEPVTPTPKPTPAKDTTKPTLTVSLSNATENTFTNKDVVVNVSAKDNSGKVTVKYAFDCSSNCNYQNVSGGKITVTKEGTTVVSVQAVDPSGNKETKSVTVKIDKTKPSCSLKVQQDGTIVAAYSDGGSQLAYYGFNMSYSGTNESSKKVTTAGGHNFFVKDNAGNINSCFINVNTKVQYRSRTCDNSHKKFGSWYVRKQVYITSCGQYAKGDAERAYNTWYRTRSNADASKCNGSSPCYYCTAYARSITGCNWGDEAWGAYQDSPIEETNTVQVEKTTIFY